MRCPSYDEMLLSTLLGLRCVPIRLGDELLLPSATFRPGLLLSAVKDSVKSALEPFRGVVARMPLVKDLERFMVTSFLLQLATDSLASQPTQTIKHYPPTAYLPFSLQAKTPAGPTCRLQQHF